KRGQKCLKRRFSRRSPVGEWSVAARARCLGFLAGVAAVSRPRSSATSPFPPWDLYGAFSVKRFPAAQSRPSSRRQVGRSHFFEIDGASSLVEAGKTVLRPVACGQVPGARGRGQGTETLGELGGGPP